MKVTFTYRMYVILFLFLFPVYVPAEQEKEKNPEHRKKQLFDIWDKTYGSVYCRTGGLFYDPTNLGRLQVRIPYTYTLSSLPPFSSRQGKGVLTLDKNQVFPRPAVYMAPLVLEGGGNGYFVNLNFLGFMVNCWDGAYFSAGFGYSVTVRPLPVPHFSLRPKKKYSVVHRVSRVRTDDTPPGSIRSANPWVIKPSIQLGYYGFYRHIASIDNTNRNIYLLGCTSGPSDGNKGADTNPNSLDLYFGQQTVQLSPTLGISKGLGTMWNIGFNTSWMIPVYEQGGLALDNNGYSGHNVNSSSGWGLIPLNRPDIQALYNGKIIHDTPFRFGGLSLEFCIGFHFG
ncbi:MAG TPA: hypothetical protein VNZ86_04280 [Bacteroidia bacterium]|jgi:hypothetical protein|nr:hypothetical protein [Bacteroidia bacterium]